MVRWDNGSGLSVAYGADCCRSLVPEFTQTVRDQLMAIRDSGETNMLDVPMVQRLAFDRRLLRAGELYRGAQGILCDLHHEGRSLRYTDFAQEFVQIMNLHFLAITGLQSDICTCQRERQTRQAQSKEDKAMTNIFEETYNRIEEAKKAYKAAATAEERDAAREAAKAAEDRIDEMGDIAHKSGGPTRNQETTRTRS
jgi:hypothetical protein